MKARQRKRATTDSQAAFFKRFPLPIDRFKYQILQIAKRQRFGKLLGKRRRMPKPTGGTITFRRHLPYGIYQKQAAE